MSAPPPYGATIPPRSPPQVNVTIISGGTNLGHESCTVMCPNCRMTVQTRTAKKTTSGTHLSSVMFCLLGYWCCFLCPYCCGCCYRTDHYCPRCNSFLGSYS